MKGKNLQAIFDRIQQGGDAPNEGEIDNIARLIEREDVDLLINALLGDNVYVALFAARIIENRSFRQKGLVTGDDEFNAKLIGASFAAFEKFGDEQSFMGFVRITLCNVRPRNANYVRNWLARASVTYNDTLRGRFLSGVQVYETLKAA